MHNSVFRSPNEQGHEVYDYIPVFSCSDGAFQSSPSFRRLVPEDGAGTLGCSHVAAEFVRYVLEVRIARRAEGGS